MYTDLNYTDLDYKKDYNGARLGQWIQEFLFVSCICNAVIDEVFYTNGLRLKRLWHMKKFVFVFVSPPLAYVYILS